MEHPVVNKPLSTPKSTIESNIPYGTPCSIGPLSTPKSTIESNIPYGTPCSIGPLSTPKSTIEFNKPYGTPCNIEPLSTSRRGQDPRGRKCNSYRSPSLKPKLHQKEARSTERSHFCNRSTVKYYGTPCRKIAILT